MNNLVNFKRTLDGYGRPKAIIPDTSDKIYKHGSAYTIIQA
jgi:hypothetical protein